MDNGPELIADLMQRWSKSNGIHYQYIQPGKPMHKVCIDSFTNTYGMPIF